MVKRTKMTEAQRAENRMIKRSMDSMIFALAAHRVARFPALQNAEGEIAAIAFCRKFYTNKHDAMVACANFGV